jgi:exportin-2 (importin alpha re-exporter)
MVLYLETYIRKNSSAVVRDNQLEPILGVFNKLVASKATDHLGIQLLCTVLETYDTKTMSRYMDTIVRVLVTRLHTAKTPKYVQNLLYCLSLIVLRYGSGTLVQSTNALQQGLMAMLLSQVWIAELPSIMRRSDRRVCALAMVDIACASDLCLTEPYASLWPAMITATVALLEGVQTDAGDEVSEDEENSVMEAGDHFAGARGGLKWATQVSPSGPVQGVAPGVDPRSHVAGRVADLSERHPGIFGPLLARDVEEGARVALQSYLSGAGRTVA